MTHDTTDPRPDEAPWRETVRCGDGDTPLDAAAMTDAQWQALMELTGHAPQR